jgi:hypothetical protein
VQHIGWTFWTHLALGGVMLTLEEANNQLPLDEVVIENGFWSTSIRSTY